MLGRFRFSNRGPFREQADLNLAASHYKEHPSHKLSPGDNHPPLLRSALLIGGNGSGKSTLVEGIRYFRDRVIRIPDPEEGMNARMFREGGEVVQPAASYVWSFYHEEIRYRLKLVLRPSHVKEEILYRVLTRPGTQGKAIYQRWKAGDHVRARPVRPQVEKVEDIRKLHRMAAVTPPNGVLLTHAEKERLDLLVPMLDYFRRSVRILPGPDELPLLDILSAWPSGPFYRYLRKHLTAAKAGALLQGTENVEALLPGTKASRGSANYRFWNNYRSQKEHTARAEGLLTEGLAWYLQQLACIYEAHLRGKLLVIDGLDCGLHPDLSRRLLKCCVQPHRPSRAQFILTVHDPMLLDQSLLRRDEIWLVKKNAATGASTLKNLRKLRVRNDLKLERAYLEGRLSWL